MPFKEIYRPDNTPLTFDKMIEDYQAGGKRLEERFAIQIQQARDQYFKRLGVSSSKEVDGVLRGKNFPPFFHNNINLEGYDGEIGTHSNGEEKYILLKKEIEDENDEEEEDDRKPELNQANEMLDSIKSELLPGEKTVGFVWNAKGIEINGQLKPVKHNGVIVGEEARGQDLGYAMYRLHEEVFGRMEQEMTPVLSLLKLYLKLGFVPKKIIDQRSGQELALDVESVVEKCLAEGEEKFPFFVYLERENKNNEKK